MLQSSNFQIGEFPASNTIAICSQALTLSVERRIPAHFKRDYVGFAFILMKRQIQKSEEESRKERGGKEDSPLQ